MKSKEMKMADEIDDEFLELLNEEDVEEEKKTSETKEVLPVHSPKDLSKDGMLAEINSRYDKFLVYTEQEAKLTHVRKAVALRYIDEAHISELDHLGTLNEWIKSLGKVLFDPATLAGLEGKDQVKLLQTLLEDQTRGYERADKKVNLLNFTGTIGAISDDKPDGGKIEKTMTRKQDGSVEHVIKQILSFKKDNPPSPSDDIKNVTPPPEDKPGK